MMAQENLRQILGDYCLLKMTKLWQNEKFVQRPNIVICRGNATHINISTDKSYSFSASKNSRNSQQTLFIAQKIEKTKTYVHSRHTRSINILAIVLNIVGDTPDLDDFENARLKQQEVKESENKQIYIKNKNASSDKLINRNNQLNYQ